MYRRLNDMPPSRIATVKPKGPVTLVALPGAPQLSNGTLWLCAGNADKSTNILVPSRTNMETPLAREQAMGINFDFSMVIAALQSRVIAWANRQVTKALPEQATFTIPGEELELVLERNNQYTRAFTQMMRQERAAFEHWLPGWQFECMPRV